MTRRIVIVGAGAAGTAMLWALARHRVGDIVDVVDPRTPGRGWVFDMADPLLICNTSVGVMSLHGSDRNDFLHHLRVEGREVGPDDFVPRMWFGQYGASRWRYAAALHRELGAAVRYVRSRAERIERLADDVGERYRVHLDDGGWLAADDVIVCPGVGPPLLPELVDRFDGAPGLHRSPFPTSALLTSLSPQSNVLVIGTRLSAVDAALVLCAGGHRVSLVSRSGAFPAVRTAIWHSGLAPIDRGGFVTLAPDNERLPSAVLRLIRRATATAGNLPITAQVSFCRDPVARLRDELALAEAGESVWQETVAELIELVNEWLADVRPDVRRQAMRTCRSLISRYVSSMPAGNARRMLTLLDSGAAQLAHECPTTVAPEPDGWWCTWPGGRRERFDAVVCATGFAAPPIGMQHDGVSLDDLNAQAPVIDANLRVRLPGSADASRIRLIGTASHARFPIVNYVRTAVLQAEHVACDLASGTGYGP